MEHPAARWNLPFQRSRGPANSQSGNVVSQSCRLNGSRRARLLLSLCRRRPETNAEAPVLAPLLLDLGDVDFADFRRRAHMRSAAGLAVDRTVGPDQDK